VSEVSDVADSQVLYGSARDIRASGFAPGFDALLADVWRERGFGDFWGYALVAEGAAESMVELGVNAWDLAAPLVLIEEAGGRLTDYDGRRTIQGRSVVASNGHLHDEILAVLAGTAE
jgi:histidinol-phosphatase